MKDILSRALDLIKSLLAMIINALPDSPFLTFTNYLANKDTTVSHWLGILNYFFPIALVLQTLAVWLTAIAIYYGISVIMRWVKVVSD